MKPRIFVGSSTESLAAAETFQVLLRHRFEVHLWKYALEATHIVLDRLLETKANFQFAIFVFGPDDIATIRRKTVLIPRDNVVFEAGIFMSHLGRERTFIVIPDIPETNGKATKLHVLSDFSGLICLTYHPPAGSTSPDWNASLGGVCTEISRRIDAVMNKGTGRIRKLPGRWIGKVNQDASANRPATEYDWDSHFESNGNSIVGKFKLRATSEEAPFPGWPDVLEFDVRGEFEHERFLKMEYEYVDKAALQFGLALLELNPQGLELTGRFLGFGALSQQLVSGAIRLERG